MPRVIDLSLPLYTGMPVYPGDPETLIEPVLTLDRDGWEMRRLQINAHDATHVNTQSHGHAGGKALDDYPLERFFGPACLYRDGMTMAPGTGVVFHVRDIDPVIAQRIVERRPHFVGLSCAWEIDEAILKDLLAADVVVFERLANTDQLPETFTFHGLPLNIRGGDGSPVRAFAIVD